MFLRTTPSEHSQIQELQRIIDAALARTLKLALVSLGHLLQLSAIDGQSLEPRLDSQQTGPLTLQIGQHFKQISFFFTSATDLQLVLNSPGCTAKTPT